MVHQPQTLTAVQQLGSHMIDPRCLQQFLVRLVKAMIRCVLRCVKAMPSHVAQWGECWMLDSGANQYWYVPARVEPSQLLLFAPDWDGLQSVVAAMLKAR